MPEWKSISGRCALLMPMPRASRLLNKQRTVHYQCFNKQWLKRQNASSIFHLVCLRSTREKFRRNETVLKNAIWEKWWTEGAKLNEREKKHSSKERSRMSEGKSCLIRKIYFPSLMLLVQKNLALWAEHGENIENFMLGTSGQWSSRRGWGIQVALVVLVRRKWIKKLDNIV